MNGALGLALVVTLLLAAANPVCARARAADRPARGGARALRGDARAHGRAAARATPSPGCGRTGGAGSRSARGLVALAAVGVTAIRFYADRPAAWPLAFLTLYLIAAALLFAVLVWTLAVAEPAAPLRVAARRAAELAATRPGGTLADRARAAARQRRRHRRRADAVPDADARLHVPRRRPLRAPRRGRLMAPITFDHVTKRFGDTVAVDELSIEVADGEFLVLVGPSGCGKSTALRLLAGPRRPQRRPHPDRQPPGQPRDARARATSPWSSSRTRSTRT